MKGSITFRFGGDPSDYRVHISKQGELDRADLEVVAALLHEDIIQKKALESDEIAGQQCGVWTN